MSDLTTSKPGSESTVPAQSMPTPSAPVTTPPVAANSTPDVLYCANHPNTETLLRCNRCGKPICLKCAVLTDVGYRCKECIRGVQASYFTAIPADNLIALGVAFIIAAIAAPILSIIFGFVPFFWGIILAFAIGSAAGSMLAQIIRKAVGKRRGRTLPYYAISGIVLGVLISYGVVALITGVLPLNPSALIFTVLAAASAYQFLR